MNFFYDIKAYYRINGNLYHLFRDKDKKNINRYARKSVDK